MFIERANNRIYRKVHTRTPILIQEIHLPLKINDAYSKIITGNTNFEINSFKPMTEMQGELKALEFKRLIEKQKLAQNRSGDLRYRISQMEKCGYPDIWKEATDETKNALLGLKSVTVSTLNDFQLFRILISQDPKNSLKALEKEFDFAELQRISERDNSTIINTWLMKFPCGDKSFECLTKYIHEIARK